MTTHENFLSNVRDAACAACAIDRAEPRVHAHLGAAVPRHRLQLPAARASRHSAGTSVIMPAFDVAAFLARDRGRADLGAHHACRRSTGWRCSSRTSPSIDTSSVRVARYGGAPIAPDLVHRIQAGVPDRARRQRLRADRDLVGRRPTCRTSDAAEHADSVGFAAPVVDVALDAADPDSGVGELLIRGPNVVAGYWRKPEQTARDVRRRLAAHRRPGPHRRRRAWSTSSTARRT